MAKGSSKAARVDDSGGEVGGSSDSRSRPQQVSDLNRRYQAWTVPKWNDVPLDRARNELEMLLTAEIKENLDTNQARLDELVAIRDIDDHRVSSPARWFELPGERDDRLKRWVKAGRRERRLRRLKVVSAMLLLIAYCVGIVAAGILLPIPAELVLIGLAAPVVIVVLAVAQRFLLPGPPPPRVELEPLTPEALMMQRFLDLADGISATEAWRSDVAGRLDLDLEQHDIGDQLRQMEELGTSIASLTGSEDKILAHALTTQRARLSSVRMSMVDRLAVLDRYRMSLEQVDIDTERAAKFGRVDEICSAMDMLEVGRASSEFSIGHTTRVSDQLDQSIRISRQMLEELRGHH